MLVVDRRQQSAERSTDIPIDLMHQSLTIHTAVTTLKNSFEVMDGDTADTWERHFDFNTRNPFTQEDFNGQLVQVM